MMALHWIPLWFRSLYPLEAENVDSPLLSKPGIQKPAFYFHTYPLEKQRRAKNSFQMWKLRALLCVLEQVLSLSIPAIVTKEIPDFFFCATVWSRYLLAEKTNKFHDRTVMSHVSAYILFWNLGSFVYAPPANSTPKDTYLMSTFALKRFSLLYKWYNIFLVQ